MATGADPIPGTPHDNRPEIQNALSRPLPDDPKQFRDLWQQLTREEKDWLYRQNHWIGNTDGMAADDRDTYNRLNLKDLLAQAQATRSPHLPDLQAIRQAVQDNPGRKLLLLDTQSGRQVHAAIAVGDPDTATDIAVTTPGLNTTVQESMKTTTEEARRLNVEALRQLNLVPGHGGDTVSTIARIGHDAPQIRRRDAAAAV